MFYQNIRAGFLTITNKIENICYLFIYLFCSHFEVTNILINKFHVLSKREDHPLSESANEWFWMATIECFCFLYYVFNFIFFLYDNVQGGNC